MKLRRCCVEEPRHSEDTEIPLSIAAIISATPTFVDRVFLQRILRLETGGEATRYGGRGAPRFSEDGDCLRS